MPINNSEYTTEETSVETLLRTAQQGNRDALGMLLDRYRDYLTKLTFHGLDSAIKPREAVSDVIQQSCLEAHRDIFSFRGTTEQEFRAWLKKIHENNIAHAVQRHVVTEKRSVKKERYNSNKERSRIFFANDLPSQKSSPSQAAMRKEDIEKLMKIIESLPEDQQRAIKLRHLEGKSIADIATIMHRSEAAIGGLLKRGLRYLRKHFQEM